MGFILELLMDGDKNFPLELVKEIEGIQACFDVSNFWTNLSEITIVKG